MKNQSFIFLFFIIYSCSSKEANNSIHQEQNEIQEVSIEIENIESLVCNYLKWTEENQINLTPILIDQSQQKYILNDSIVSINKEILMQSNLFDDTFLNQYEIALSKFKNKLTELQFNTNEHPFLGISGDASPWTLTQDIPSDTFWEDVEIQHINNDNYVWKFGNLAKNTDSSWKLHQYKFKVIRSDKGLKISWLEGFEL